MPYLYILHERAYEEYIDAYKWYALKKEGLGDEFMYYVEKKIQQIIEHPKYYSKKQRNYRETKVENFPYIIVYEFFENRQLIHIAAIYHTKRNPKRKYRRIK